LATWITVEDPGLVDIYEVFSLSAARARVAAIRINKAKIDVLANCFMEPPMSVGQGSVNSGGAYITFMQKEKSN
jgi:hypothetical protein